MSLHTRDRYDRYPSIGVDAALLAPYSAVQTDEKELMIYDEDHADAWIQSTLWTTAEDRV